MTVSNALFTEQEVIKETNSALEDIQETLALSLVDSLKAGDHITTPIVIDMLKDLEDMQLKYYDRLDDIENTPGTLANQENHSMTMTKMRRLMKIRTKSQRAGKSLKRSMCGLTKTKRRSH